MLWLPDAIRVLRLPGPPRRLPGSHSRGGGIHLPVREHGYPPRCPAHPIHQGRWILGPAQALRAGAPRIRTLDADGPRHLERGGGQRLPCESPHRDGKPPLQSPHRPLRGRPARAPWPDRSSESAAHLAQTVWVTVRGRFIIDHPRTKGGRTYARVEVSEFALGKQPVGRWLLWLMLGPAGSKLLRFQVPTIVDSVQIEERRVMIRTQ